MRKIDYEQILVDRGQDAHATQHEHEKEKE